MKIVDRYVLREYLIPLAYCLSAFLLIYVIFDLFDRFPELLESRVSLGNALRFYGHFLFAVNGFVPFPVVILPIALLLSELYTLTALALRNELTAMRAGGMSLYRLIYPFLGVGLVAAVVSLAIQEAVGPYATRWKSAFERGGKASDRMGVVSRYVYHSGSLGRYWLISRFDPSAPEDLNGVMVVQQRKDGSLEKAVFADKARWLDGRWWFTGQREQKYDLREEPVGGQSAPSPRPVEMRELTETPEDFRKELLQTDAKSSLDMYQYLRRHPGASCWSRSIRVEMHARLAMPWTCLVVVLMGMPAVMTTGRRGAMGHILLALGFLFAFYFLVYTGMILGKGGQIPAWLAGWLPNLVFGAVGLFLLRRIRC